MEQEAYVMGIDTGKTGAVGLVSENGAFLAVFDVPLDEVGWIELGNEIEAAYGRPKAVFVEQVNPGVFTKKGQKARTQGVISAFNMGGQYRMACLWAASFGVRWDTVPPGTWKKTFGLIKKEKEDSRQYARRLFPDAPLERKKDHNRAEGLLIGEWGRKYGL